MPVTLTRSLLVVIIPGLIAIAPWALWLALKIEDLVALYKTYATLINASVLGLAIILGSVLEGLLSHVELRWDREREKKYQVRRNWFDYLAHEFSTEPVGFRYLARMATSLYFELAMMAASVLAMLGVAALVIEYAPGAWKGASLLVALAAVFAGQFFYNQAKASHEVLCETRKEINTRLNGRGRARGRGRD
jgi:hypothetical protein